MTAQVEYNIPDGHLGRDPTNIAFYKAAVRDQVDIEENKIRDEYLIKYGLPAEREALQGARAAGVGRVVGW